LGLVPHVNLVFENFARGEYFALAGGDDISLPERIYKCSDLILHNQDLMAITVNFITINEDGKEIKGKYYQNEKKYLLNKNYFKTIELGVEGGGLFIKKEVFHIFGPFNNTCPTEDSTFRFRALLLGNIILCDQSLLFYRRHRNNLTSNLYSLKTKEIAKQYFIDLKKANNFKIISKRIYFLLRVKIYLYQIEREVSSKIQNTQNNKYIIFYWKVVRKIIRIIATCNAVLYKKNDNI